MPNIYEELEAAPEAPTANVYADLEKPASPTQKNIYAELESSTVPNNYKLPARFNVPNSGGDYGLTQDKDLTASLYGDIQKVPRKLGDISRAIPADIAAGLSLLKRPEGQEDTLLPPPIASQLAAVKLNLPYAAAASGNIPDALKGQPLPIDAILADVSKDAPIEATIGKISQGLAASAPFLALGQLPAAVGRMAALGFTADMIKNAGEDAAIFGEEMGKNPEDRDNDKLTSAASGLIQSFTAAPFIGAHATKDVVKGVVDRLKSTPATKPIIIPEKATAQTPVIAAKEVTPPVKPSPPIPPTNVAEEVLNSESPKTGIKNAAIDKQRAERGLEPIMKPESQVHGPLWESTMKRIEDDPTWQDRTIAELLEKPRAMTPQETFGMIQREADLRNEYDKASQEAAMATEEGRKDDAKSASDRANYFSDRMAELEKATEASGTEWGRSGVARKRMANDDFSLASMEMSMRRGKGWEPLTPDERAKLILEHKKIVDAMENEHKVETEKANATYKSEIEGLKNDLKTRPKYSSHVTTLLKGFVERANREGDAAALRIKGRLSRTSTGLDPTILKDVAEVVFKHLANGAETLAEVSGKLIDEFSDAVKPYIEKGFEQGKAIFEGKAKRQVLDPESIRNHSRPKKTITPEERRNQIIDALKDDPNDKAYLSRVAREIAKVVIETGEQDREKILDSTHEVLRQAIPDISRRQAMDAISRYGQFSELSKEAAQVRLREVSGEYQQVAKIEDIQAKKPLLKTGHEMPQKTNAHRWLEQKVNELKKKFGIVTTDPARQLKSTLDSRKTYIKNRMADLRQEIETRERIVKEKSLPPTDAELDSLRKEYGEVKKEHDSVFGKREMSDEARHKAALASAERQSVIWEDRLQRAKKGDFSNPDNPSQKITSPQIDAIRAATEHVREQVKELHDLDPSNVAEKAAVKLEAEKAVLEKDIAAKEAALKSGDLDAQGKPVNRPASNPEIEQLKLKRDALNKQIADARKAAKPKKSADEISNQRLKTSLKNQEAIYRKRLAEKDFTKRNIKTFKSDPETIAARATVEKLKNDWRRAREQDRIAKRTSGDKLLDGVIAFSRAAILSSPTIFKKLFFASLGRVASIALDSSAGLGLRMIPGLSKIAQNAPFEGKMSPKAILAGVASLRQGVMDSFQTLKTGESELSNAYGKPHEKIPGRVHAVMEFAGRVHAAIKAPIKRAVFELSLVNANLWNESHGVNIEDPIQKLRIAKEAYGEAERSIFQDKNDVSERIKAFERKRIDKVTGKETLTSKSVRTGTKVAIPIRTVPANIVSEAFDYLGGSVLGSVKAVKVLREHAETLNPAQNDQIMRHLKKGAVGPAIFLLGWYAYKNIGGFFQNSQIEKKKPVKSGHININGTDFGHNELDAPFLEVLQAGATFHEEWDRKVKKEEKGPMAAAGATVLGLLSSAPIARETFDFGQLGDPNRRDYFFADWVKSRVLPQIVSKTAEHFDKDTSGNTVKRYPKNIVQTLESGIPVFRKNVASKK